MTDHSVVSLATLPVCVYCGATILGTPRTIPSEDGYDALPICGDQCAAGLFEEHRKADPHCTCNDCLEWNSPESQLSRMTAWADRPLEMFQCQPASSRSSAGCCDWYRLWTCRDGEWRISDVSLDMGRRLALKLAEAHGIPPEDRAGLFTGRVFIVRR